MRKHGFIKNFRRNRRGSTAVEFALIAGPFFFFLMALIEVAAVFFASTVIENAVLESARLIRTGQLQNGGGNAATFQTEVCNRIAVVADCDRMAFEVAVFEDFDAITPTAPLDSEGNMNAGNMGFDPGDAGDIVLVRVYYSWPLFLPNFAGQLSNMSDNRRLITAATVFRNEPFNE
ncbi:TadE/TadG family type IV pilus assembly protein [Hyphobacterium marinum]|uniref:TadE/TadG family type IV pilus assembly protein n=1 Tax=Hyphobacterium marinum TaxID=3116574 RepID=A0ABU7LWY9_9PROT|nr:TadE/TadG family type IV pilus assembly protein [Hyphobacterium sp. Y6023]MEE2565787.1 TadE/TadG family type IV pilus assembly protein [Hyphobacterium sp. Y6023]